MTQFCFTETKKKCVTVIDMLLSFRHLRGPLVRTEGRFFTWHTLEMFFFCLFFKIIVALLPSVLVPTHLQPRPQWST